MKKNNSLFEEMKQFQKEKTKYFVFFILLGFAGLVIPVIPGLVFIGLGIALINPKSGTELFEKILDRIKSLFFGWRQI